MRIVSIVQYYKYQEGKRSFLQFSIVSYIKINYIILLSLILFMLIFIFVDPIYGLLGKKKKEDIFYLHCSFLGLYCRVNREVIGVHRQFRDLRNSGVFDSGDITR